MSNKLFYKNQNVCKIWGKNIGPLVWPSPAFFHRSGYFIFVFHHGNSLWNSIKVLSLIKQCIGHNMKRIKVFIQYRIHMISRLCRIPKLNSAMLGAFAWDVSFLAQSVGGLTIQAFLTARTGCVRNLGCFVPKISCPDFLIVQQCSWESTTRIVQFKDGM